jgi:hypothetical protein
MSPQVQARGKQTTVPDNLYTVILAVAFFVVLATAGLVAYKCFSQYETLFGIP